MKINSLKVIFLFCAIIMASIQQDNLLHLKKFYPYQRSIKINYLREKRTMLDKEQLLVFQIWNSILTGNSRWIQKETKEKYRDLALSHIFTPSGFHLTALLFPFKQLLPNSKAIIYLLALLGPLVLFLPGLFAFKRMIGVKILQRFCGKKAGFSVAFLLDFIFGSFHKSPLSFTYSLIFLSIIFSKARPIKLTFLLFFAQSIIAFFSESELSPLILFWSPILNFLITIFLPFLFLLSFPMMDWQLWSGLYLIKAFHKIVLFAYETTLYFPTLEISLGLFTLFFLFYLKRWICFGVILFIISSTLNKPDVAKLRSMRIELAEEGNFKCERNQYQGHWISSCFPNKRSRKKI